jgi:hypothetical protein
MIVLLTISVVFNAVLLYAAWNSVRKIEMLEDSISNFYSRTQSTLNTMRELDEKQMFEKDDEVGDLFAQLTDTVNELRPFIYGSMNDDGQEDNRIR